MDTKKDLGKIRGIGRKTVVIIIIAVIVILMILLVLFKINFLIGEQLRITLTPEYSELKTTSPGSVPFEVNMHLYNKFVCDAECSYALIDESNNITLDNGTFHSKAYKSKSYSFNIPLNYYGYGTNIYLYRLECKNIETPLCPTSDDLLVRKSLLAVTYSPSAEQLSALDFSKNNYALISADIINASRFIAANEDVINSMSESNISFDSAKYYALKSERDSLYDAINGLMSIWRKNDYIATKSFLTNIGLVNRSSALLNDVTRYNVYLTTTINSRNLLFSELVAVHSTLEGYENILQHNITNLNLSERQSMIDVISNGNILMNKFNNPGNYNNRGSIYNYSLAYVDVIKLKNITVNINNIIVNDTEAELSFDYPSLYIYSNMLCMMNVSINMTLSNGNTFCDYDYALNVNNLIDASTKLNNICYRSSDIINSIKIMTNNSGISSNPGNFNLGNLSNDSMETLLLQYKLLIDYGSSYDNSGKNPIWTAYANYLRNNLKKSYNITNPEALLPGYVLNKSLITFNNNLLLSDIRNMNISCGEIGTASASALPTSVPITAKYYPLPSFDVSNVTASQVNPSPPSPPEIVPQCCMYGKCQSCDKTKTSSDKNPLILLHGHSFNQNTHAYQSIEIFDSFEHQLSNDELYYPTGMLIANENSTSGILGRYYIPLVSKPTYYLETYNDLLGLTVSESKTGNIDTYALRLKESIDYTMYITGSSKVDIVAHSMGGLVVRRYMQVFGTQNIGTVILVATPNNGISDKTYNLCKIFGASNECEDMRTSGIFIKKLNDFSNQPDIKNLYLVVGQGCSTDGVDGDGVITVSNSLLSIVPDSRVLYVNGTCSGTTFLHNELLNVDKYPEVYEFVKEKLG